MATSQTTASDSDSTFIDPFNQVIEELDFKNTDLRDIVRVLAKKYDINVFVENDVKKRLTLHLVNVRLGDALNFIVEDNSLILKKYGNIYKIMNPPEPEPPPKEWKIEYKNGLLTVDFKDEDIRKAINEIAKITGKTILVERRVSGSITGMINTLPFEEALAHLLKINGYRLRKEGTIYYVQPMVLLTGEGATPSGSLWITVNKGFVNFELQNAPLTSVVDEIARQAGINFFLLGDLQGTVTARVTNLPLEECLNLILLDKNYTFKRSGDVYLIGDKNNKGLISTQLIELKHLKVDGVIEMLPRKVTQNAELKIIKEHNALLVNGSRDVISEIQQILKDIDRPIPQVFFEALVVDFKTFDVKDFSVEAGLTGGKTPDTSRGTFDLWIPGIDILWSGANVNKYLGELENQFRGINIGRLPSDFYLRIKALESAGKANIRSIPQISTLNGHTAELKVGETRYFKLITETPIRDPSQLYIQRTERFQTVEINISLKITPWVSASGEITVEIHPEFNTPGEQIAIDVPPNVQSRSLTSTVRLRDGETIVLGGLIQEVDNESISRVPILGRIPLLGTLFRSKNHNKTKSELIIYVTPHLTYSDDWLSPP